MITKKFTVTPSTVAQDLDLKIEVNGFDMAPQSIYVLNDTSYRAFLQPLTVKQVVDYLTNPDLYETIPVVSGSAPFLIEEEGTGVSIIKYSAEGVGTTPETMEITAFNYEPINIGS